MASENDRHVHAALGDKLAYRAVDRAHDFRDDAALDVVYQMFVDSKERGREERKVFYAKFRARVDDHVDDVISVAHVVVERYRHAALEP